VRKSCIRVRGPHGGGLETGQDGTGTMECMTQIAEDFRRTADPGDMDRNRMSRYRPKQDDLKGEY